VFCDCVWFLGVWLCVCCVCACVCVVCVFLCVARVNDLPFFVCVCVWCV